MSISSFLPLPVQHDAFKYSQSSIILSAASKIQLSSDGSLSGHVARWHGRLCSSELNSLMTGIRAWQMDFGPFYICVNTAPRQLKVLIFRSKIPHNRPLNSQIDKGFYQIDSFQSNSFQMVARSTLK